LAIYLFSENGLRLAPKLAGPSAERPFFVTFFVTAGHVWPLKHGLPVRPQPVAPGVLGNGGNGSQVSQVGMDPAKNAHALPYLLEKQVPFSSRHIA